MPCHCITPTLHMANVASSDDDITYRHDDITHGNNDITRGNDDIVTYHMVSAYRVNFTFAVIFYCCN